MAQMQLAFPQGFVWGASTASYQIEGAVSEDGRSPSIWDTFSHEPGRIDNGDTGDVACDHYHRYREDVALMRDANLSAYRFSIAWPRVLPDGVGPVNAKGVDFYDRLVDALLEAGIEPWPCLYHWDLPQALQERGGWENRDIAHWFSGYAEIMARKLGDRVSRWIMLNEPQVTAHRGFAYGKYAPGFADRHKFFAVTHHQNLAQGDAVRALRAVNSEFDLGTVFNLSVPVAASDSEDDQRAAVVYDSMWNRNFLDPLFKGSYPDLGEADLRPFLQRGDMERIAQPIDFLGLNYYCRSFCKWDENHPLKVARSSPVTDLPRTCLDWEILPSGMTEMLLRLRDEYGNPTVYISENGAAFYEADVEAAVSDVARVDFLDGYLRAAHRAVEAGVNLKGYFVWSIIDNFEWAWGYAPRFGIVHVDYDTQTRTPKQSYHWYATVAQQNALPIRNED